MEIAPNSKWGKRFDEALRRAASVTILNPGGDPANAENFEYCNRASSYPQRFVYNYVFSWHTPLFDGRPRAFHTSDVAFVFDNAQLVTELTGGGDPPGELPHRMSTYWTNFGRTGDPNDGASVQPHWPRYGAAQKHVMIFDDPCRAEAMPDKEMIDLFLQDATAVSN